MNKIKAFLQKYWQSHYLANNLKRECETISTILDLSKISLDELNEVIEKHTRLGRGANLLNLSPHGAIIQSLFDDNNEKFKNFVQKKINSSNSKKTILIVDEIDVPSDVLLSDKTYGSSHRAWRNRADSRFSR